MRFNYEIKKLRESIARQLNESLLPIEVKRLCMYEMVNQLAAISECQTEKEALEEYEATTTKRKGE